MKTERVARGNYIQGHFLPVNDPNGEVMSRDPGNLDAPALALPFCYEHVREAVAAARHGFPSWRRLTPAARVKALGRYRDLLANRAREIARHVAFEVGKPLWEAADEIRETLNLIDYFMEQVTMTPLETRIERAEGDSAGFVRFHPRGVMAVVTPAHQPVLGAHAHFFPALAHGNTIVLKASKAAPFTGQYLAEIVHESSLPAGSVNVIQGDAEVARRLTLEAEVDGIFFTGHPETGAKILKQVFAEYWKLVVLELGGKNSTILWDDCDYKRALHEALLAAFLTSGQRPVSANRILVHEKIFDRFVEDFHKLAKKCKVGHSLAEGDATPFMGPLLDETVLENYLRYQGIAVREGCEELMRGKPLERDERGYYVSPSIHLVHRPDPKSVYQKSEFFGPNAGIYRFSDVDDAREILSISQHGLVASIYTRARENYLRLADDARVGIVHWNRPTVSPAYRLPYGGLRRSGNARLMGSDAIRECTYTVSSLEGREAPAAFPAAMPRLDG